MPQSGDERLTLIAQGFSNGALDFGQEQELQLLQQLRGYDAAFAPEPFTFQNKPGDLHQRLDPSAARLGRIAAALLGASCVKGQRRGLLGDLGHDGLDNRHGVGIARHEGAAGDMVVSKALQHNDVVALVYGWRKSHLSRATWTTPDAGFWSELGELDHDTA